jgi:hypothetical protein
VNSITSSSSVIVIRVFPFVGMMAPRLATESEHARLLEVPLQAKLLEPRSHHHEPFRHYLPEKGIHMIGNKSSTTQWRKRQAALGFVRVELLVRKEDVSLVREIASALGDPSRHDATRAVLRDQITRLPSKSFKALLANAPLEGIDLDRPKDFGDDGVRPITLRSGPSRTDSRP